MMKFRYVVVVLLLVLTLEPLSAQRKNKAYLDYIEQYKSIAIKHQKLYGIPASITLAQGLLESGAGRSELARKSNNHFGIKCHSDWKGKRVYHDDDRKDDCFRKYDSPEDSYEDHAKFLKRARYASLFELKVTDYRGWAKGLKACGYATDRSYANKLIQTIELYELYEYDRPKFKPIRAQDLPPVVVENPHAVYRSWGLLYVEARDGDTLESIAQEFGFSANALSQSTRYPRDYPLEAGDIVYLEKKKKKAEKGYDYAVVRSGRLNALDCPALRHPPEEPLQDEQVARRLYPLGGRYLEAAVGVGFAVAPRPVRGRLQAERRQVHARRHLPLHILNP